jgi:hypothetical protein
VRRFLHLQVDRGNPGDIAVQRPQRGVRDLQQVVAVRQLGLRVVALEMMQALLGLAPATDFVGQSHVVADAGDEGLVLGRPQAHAPDLFVADHADQLAATADRGIEQ